MKVKSESIVGVDITDKYILLKESSLREEYRGIENRVLLATGGFGCKPDTIGRAVFTADPLNPGITHTWERWNRSDVEGTLSESQMKELLNVQALA